MWPTRPSTLWPAQRNYVVGDATDHVMLQKHRNYGWPVCILALYSRPTLFSVFLSSRIFFPPRFYTNSAILNNSLLGHESLLESCTELSVRWTLALSRFFTSRDIEFDVAVVVGRRGGCKEKPPPTFLSFPLPEIHITALLVYVRVAWLAHGDVSTTNNTLPTTHIQNYPLP